jgi:hypothetical protein
MRRPQIKENYFMKVVVEKDVLELRRSDLFATMRDMPHSVITLNSFNADAVAEAKRVQTVVFIDDQAECSKVFKGRYPGKLPYSGPL